MTALLLKALSRAGQTLHNPFNMGRTYVMPRRGEPARDFQRVTKDMKTVGNDLRTTAKRELQKHGK